MIENREMRLAVLVDADNAQRSRLKNVMDEIAKYGLPTVKRAYGDWGALSGWKDVLLENAVTPVQQYAYTTGKNATDSKMIIDAMDLLHAGNVDGFVLVSSDSDFTPLAMRLRESGKRVVGIGEKKTPRSFIASCDQFIYVEILDTPPTTGSKRDSPVKTQPVPKDIVALIGSCIAETANDEGFANLSHLASLILKKHPDFDTRTYGYGKFMKFLQSISNFEVVLRDDRPLVRLNKGKKNKVN